MPSENTNFVRGTLRDQEARPLSGLIVEIYDKDMRKETLLGGNFSEQNQRGLSIDMPKWRNTGWIR